MLVCDLRERDTGTQVRCGDEMHREGVGGMVNHSELQVTRVTGCAAVTAGVCEKAG